MSVPVRDLRNRSAAVLARVERGERVIVTKDGDPVAALVPLPRRPLTARELIARRQHLPRVDAKGLRADIDAVLDARL
jgi:prevent-host-death family protein